MEGSWTRIRYWPISRRLSQRSGLEVGMCSWPIRIQYPQFKFGFWRNNAILLSLGGMVISLANGGTLSKLELRVLYVLANKELMGVKTKKIDSSNILILILSWVLDNGFLWRMFRQSAPAKAGRRLRPTDLLNLMPLLCLSCPRFNS